jgi:hypothetical protein
MAIVYKKKKKACLECGTKILMGPKRAQQGLSMERSVQGPIDDDGKPISKRIPYRSKAVKAAPYLSEWLQDPITIQKIDEQFGEGIADKMQKNIGGLGLIDMRKLGSMSPMQFKEFAHEYSTKKRLLPAHRQYKENRSALGRMRELGQTYDPVTGRGVQGVRIKNFPAIGTIYDVMDVDKYGTGTHELTHATGYQPVAEKYIYDKWGSKQLPLEKVRGLGFDESEEQLNYLRDIGVGKEGAEGAYPRIMQLRKMLNLKPGQTVTPEMFKGIKFEDKKSPLRGLRANWDDATIIDIMNTVAESRIANQYDNTLMA